METSCADRFFVLTEVFPSTLTKLLAAILAAVLLGRLDAGCLPLAEPGPDSAVSSSEVSSPSDSSSLQLVGDLV